jgi:cadmium resistance protein CadD (predicted permease)
MSGPQQSVGEFIGAAFISFMATNIDDLVVLMNFFTEATMPNAVIKPRHIFIGQYLGFFIILAVSLIGYAVAYAVPVEMVGFLGFLPIILGLKGVVEIIKEFYKKSTKNVNDIIPNTNIATIELTTIQYPNDVNGEITSETTVQKVEEQNPTIDSVPSTTQFKQKIVNLFSHCCNLQILKIASITVANGADNIAIYTPLFAQASKWQICVYIGIFLGMIFVWLIISYLFINFRPILNLAQKYAHYIVPLVFIGIGIYILVKSECFPWLERAIRTKDFKAG